MSPTVVGFTVGRVERSSGGILSWERIGDAAQWEAAVDAARWMALKYGVRAWGRRTGDEYVELVLAYDAHAPWPAPWLPFDRRSIERDVPHTQGVYLIGDGSPFFVGDTDDLRTRLLYHLRTPPPCLDVAPRLLCSFQATTTLDEQRAMTSRLITRWSPRCNGNS